MATLLIDEILTLDDDSIKSFVEQRIKQITPQVKKTNGDNDANNVDYFIPDNVGIISVGGLGDIYSFFVKDDSLEIYINLVKNLKKLSTHSFEEIMRSVATTIFDYVGGNFVKGDIKKRLTIYREAPAEIPCDSYALLTDFKNTGLAYCTERSAIANNLLHFLGFKTIMTYQTVNISNQGHFVKELHCFNLVSNGDKLYLFDSSLLDPNGEFSLLAINDDCCLQTDNGFSLSKIPPVKIRGDKVVNYTPKPFVYDRNDYSPVEKTPDVEISL